MIKHAKMISLLGVLAALVAFMFLRAGGVKAAPDIRVKAWTVVSSPNVGSGDNHLQAISAITASDTWAVGYATADSSSPSQALIEHWNGTQWSVVSSPQPNGWTSDLAGVAAISSNDVWAVGSYVTTTSTFILIEHWDGTQWSIVSSPNPGAYRNNLNGIIAISSSDVWAVGNFAVSNSSSSRTLTEHWDGQQWSVVPSPNVGSNDNLFTSVAAISTTDVWAAGIGNGGLVEHWDGTHWSIVLKKGTPYFTAISAISHRNVWVVGWVLVNGNQQTAIEHWNGRKWNTVTSPLIPVGLNEFLGVTAISSYNIWAVGYADPHTLIEHWNGSQWSIVSSPDGGPKENFLLGVTSVPGTKQVLAVGYYYIPNNNFETIGTAQTLVESYP